MPTFQSLLDSRSYADGTPHFWEPQPINPVPMTLFGTDDMPCMPEWGVESTIEKMLALGLFLELPVGQWVYQARKSELNISDTARKLLHTNIKDEHAHERGFQYAASAYPISADVMNEASHIADTWLNSESHVMERATMAEVGVFLPSLGVMRLCGGSSLCEMSEQISRDETRHVTTNRGVLTAMGLDPSKPTTSLQTTIKGTLDWLFNGLNVPGDSIGEDFDLDKDFMLQSSTELIATGIAERLDSVMDFQVHTLPFETSNHKQYSRTVVDPSIA